MLAALRYLGRLTALHSVPPAGCAAISWSLDHCQLSGIGVCRCPHGCPCWPHCICLVYCTPVYRTWVPQDPLSLSFSPSLSTHRPQTPSAVRAYSLVSYGRVLCRPQTQLISSAPCPRVFLVAVNFCPPRRFCRCANNGRLTTTWTRHCLPRFRLSGHSSSAPLRLIISLAVAPWSQ